MSGETDDLGARFRRLIRSHGPMPVARFMGESNARYYASRDPLGVPSPGGESESGGDFVTAPDISQMFGEMVGLWCADLWMRAGRPQDILYVELGPGRGTLASDALRVMHRQGLTPRIHLVEGSPVLRAKQRAALPGAQFHDDLASVPEDAPILLVANEFLDALPVRQLVRTETGWRERMIALDEDDGFAFAAGPNPMDEAVPQDRRMAEPGTIIETNPGAAAVMGEVVRRLGHQGGAALFIDYGYLAPRFGSTLQAVKAHRKVDPLAFPGSADLTALVDFAALAEIARMGGAEWLSATTQGAWLRALGIEARAAALGGEAVARDLHRLVHADEMGDLFKVMAFGGGGWPAGAGFGAGSGPQ